MMRAVVVEKAGGVDVFTLKDVKIPAVKPGWVLVKVVAFGINRSEIFTRRGDSPSVEFPRILGIECVGEIVDPSDMADKFFPGQRVICMMGGMGRQYDGSYAEYVLMPAANVFIVDARMDWLDFAATPETGYTAFGSLMEALWLNETDVLLIRGGTSSVGLTALMFAKAMGAKVISTTRDENKFDLLKAAGADFALKEQADIRSLVEQTGLKVDKVLELIGTKTLDNSLSLVLNGGIVCMAGILGNDWELNGWNPMEHIPSSTYLTVFDSGRVAPAKLNYMYEFIKKYALQIKPAKVFKLEQIREAHEAMESGAVNGKIVVDVAVPPPMW